jgi:hypothetical protein
MEKNESIQSILQGYDEMRKSDYDLGIKMKSCADRGWKKRKDKGYERKK